MSRTLDRGMSGARLPVVVLLLLLAGLGLLLIPAPVLAEGHPPFFSAVRGGGTGPDTAAAIAALPDGGSIIAGRFQGTATFGPSTLNSAGADDIVVARLDPLGSWMWAVRAGGPSLDDALGIAVSPDGPFAGSALVVGSYRQDAVFGSIPVPGNPSAAVTQGFVARIDLATGEWLWVRTATTTGSVNATFRAVAIQPGGDALVAGGVLGGTTTLTGPGGSVVDVAAGNVVLVPISSGGAWGGPLQGGNAGSAMARSMAILPDGGTVLAGSFTGMATFGSSTVVSAGNDDIMVVWVTPGLTWKWALRAGGTSFFDDAYGVTAMPDGTARVTGSFRETAAFPGTSSLVSAGGTDLFVGSVQDTGPSGLWQWAVRGGGPGFDRALGITALPDGAVAIIGQFSETATFGTLPPITTTGPTPSNGDVLVGRVGPTGTWEWVTQAGGNGIDDGRAIARTPGGVLLVAGQFFFTATFGRLPPLVAPELGQSEIFAALLGGGSAGPAILRASAASGW